MVGRNRKAKFCGRDCQVQHLRTVGPTASGNDPMTPGKTITVQLDELDQERLRQVCHEVVVSPRTWCTLLVRQRLAELRPLPPVVSS